MIIITADDYGKTSHSTDSILKCFSSGRITSTSAMVFMEDSERAAALALTTNMEVGLHLNFTLPFSAFNTPAKLREHQRRIVAYLTKHTLSQIMYNPFLTNSFNIVFLSQQEEFMRLYGKKPDFYNGHHHMHLCVNVLASKMIPKGSRVRNTETFYHGEKSPFNRFYRYILAACVSRRFISTDYFFNISPVENHERLQNFFTRAAKETVEIEVHPENDDEMDFLFSERCQALINFVRCGTFSTITT